MGSCWACTKPLYHRIEKEIKDVITNSKMNVATRNFPLKVDEIKKLSLDTNIVNEWMETCGVGNFLSIIENNFIHNYNKMLSNNEQYKIYSSLQTESKIIKKTII